MKGGLAVVLMLIAAGSEACSCYDEESLESVIRRELITSVAIVEARVLNERLVDSDQGKEQIAKFEVVRVWKGKLKAGDIFYSQSTAATAACGLSVSINESWLVFRGSDRYHHFGRCNRTDIKIQFAQERIELIERLLPEYSR